MNFRPARTVRFLHQSEASLPESHRTLIVPVRGARVINERKFKAALADAERTKNPFSAPVATTTQADDRSVLAALATFLVVGAVLWAAIVLALWLYAEITAPLHR